MNEEHVYIDVQRENGEWTVFCRDKKTGKEFYAAAPLQPMEPLPADVRAFVESLFKRGALPVHDPILSAVQAIEQWVKQPSK